MDMAKKLKALDADAPGPFGFTCPHCGGHRTCNSTPLIGPPKSSEEQAAAIAAGEVDPDSGAFTISATSLFGELGPTNVCCWVCGSDGVSEKIYITGSHDAADIEDGARILRKNGRVGTVKEGRLVGYRFNMAFRGSFWRVDSGSDDLEYVE